MPNFLHKQDWGMDKTIWNFIWSQILILFSDLALSGFDPWPLRLFLKVLEYLIRRDVTDVVITDTPETL